MCGDPTRLIDVAKHINHSDLVNQVNNFMKNQRSKSKENMSKRKSADQVEKTNKLCNKKNGMAETRSLNDTVANFSISATYGHIAVSSRIKREAESHSS